MGIMLNGNPAVKYKAAKVQGVKQVPKGPIDPKPNKGIPQLNSPLVESRQVPMGDYNYPDANSDGYSKIHKSISRGLKNRGVDLPFQHRFRYGSKPQIVKDLEKYPEFKRLNKAQKKYAIELAQGDTGLFLGIDACIETAREHLREPIKPYMQIKKGNKKFTQLTNADELSRDLEKWQSDTGTRKPTASGHRFKMPVFNDFWNKMFGNLGGATKKVRGAK